MRISSSFTFAFAGAVVLASVVACSSSTSSTGSSGCASDPFSCGAGRTCAVQDAAGTFACLPSGPDALGSSCFNKVGMTTCGDGLVCLQQTAAGGQCLSYCEPTGTAHPCPTGQTCSAAILQGTSSTFYVCAGGTTPPADAGADAARPVVDSGTD